MTKHGIKMKTKIRNTAFMKEVIQYDQKILICKIIP